MTFSIDQFRLDNRIAIVTGAGGRGNSIGRAYALGLAQAGAAVVVADINGEGANKVAEEVKTAGGKALGVQVDITDQASVARMVSATTAAFGGVDILVNNAALMAEVNWGPIAEAPLEEWNRIMAVNLTGALLCSQAVIPEMRKRGAGRIVNQVSGGAFPPTSIYGISKLALVGLTTAFARQHGKDNIAVNAIAPGNITSDAGMLLTPDDSPAIKFMAPNIAMRVRGAPDELVGTLLLLCSSAGAWITGQVMHVDGGWIIRP